MSILTETKNLDQITFASGAQADYDGNTTTDWTDSDTGTGVSTTGIFFDSKSCFKFDSGAAGAGNVAIRTRDVGTFVDPEWLTIKCYFDTLGTLAANDYFEARLDDSAYRLWIRFASDGLFVYDGASWNEVGTNLVVQDVWQEWTFKWSVILAGVVDVYLNGVLQAASVDCSYAIAGTDGTATFSQLGTSVQGVTYLDYIKIGQAQRISGEVWEMNEGGQLTIRTDTRWHANSVASMLGTVGNLTVTEGKLVFDGTKVRWIPIDTGSGTSAIGTTITQGAVTGIFLGYWSSLTAVPSATIGDSGFLKLLEVTGGPFTTGALTFGAGTGTANATGPDVTGWIEIVADSAATITVPRLGEHEIRGDWFYLADTDGTTAQQIQIPTNGGGATTYCPGVWVETVESSGTYEYWPSLAVAADGWSRTHLGGALGENDRRRNFVKDAGSGLIQFGEVSDLAAAYANVAAQASAYVQVAHTCTYAVSGNICTITYPTGHLLKTGAVVGVNFTDGGASALDGTFTITVLDVYKYTFALTTGDTSGNATVYPGLTITFTAHALGIGDTVYCDFTTGGGVDGDYTIYASGASGTAANTYIVAYPNATAVANGNVSVYSRYVITFNGHGLAIGNRVYLNFTTGAGVDGIYTIVAVPDANTFHIVANNDASADSGNVTIQQIIGNIPPDNCHVRIPNVFLREAATASRASNLVNGTIGSRPEWATGSAGAIDFEFAYSTWYMNFSQSYSMKLNDCSTYNTIIISECATALDLDNVGVSNISSLALAPLALTSDFAGGTIQNCNFQRGGAPASNGHAIAMSYCIGQTISNCLTGVVQFVRSSGYGIGLSYCSTITINNCRGINCSVSVAASNTIAVNDWDHVDRYVGYTNLTTPIYVVNVGAASVNILVDGITFGFNGVIPNVHPYSGLFTSANGTNITFRNAGTFDNPLPCGSWRQSLYAMGVCFGSGGNNYNLRTQRLYIDDNMRTSPFATINSDKNVAHESVLGGRLAMYPTANCLLLDAGLNSVMKGCKTGESSVTGQGSVYGTHFFDLFSGDLSGRYVLTFNEPTTETSSYFTMVSGTRKFNSAGGILMGVVGDQAVWEDAYYRKGHTGFQNVTPVMSGGTIGNYTLEYDIDVNDGTGWNNSWTTLSGANLSAETIDPALGFKLKIQITTTTGNITAITYLRIYTTSTLTSQENYTYDLDQYTLTLTGLQTGTKVAFLSAGTETLLTNVVTSAGGVASYTYPDTLVGSDIDIAILSAGYLYQKVLTYELLATDSSIPIAQNVDYGYDALVSATVTFNGTTKRIVCDASTTSIDVVGVYTEWVDWALTSNNLRYNNAFNELGGNTIDSGAGTSVPVYGFLVNSWRIAPDEADHTLAVTGGIILVDGGGDPFVDTTGAYTVRINYQQPVQAITVSTGGGGGATPADIWSYTTRKLTSGGNTDVASAVASKIVEGTLTLEQILRILVAVAVGKSEITDLGGGSATVVFRDTNDAKDRVTADMLNSERVTVTVDTT
jgi:hypothetical protein